MSQLSVEHIARQDGRTLVYRMRGVLGESEYSFELLEEVRRQMREGPERVVFNLEQLEYITSTGVGVIAASLASARRNERGFALCGVPPQVQRVLEIAFIWPALEHFATEDEAVAALS
jgi:anti-anti-sigma factor